MHKLIRCDTLNSLGNAGEQPRQRIAGEAPRVYTRRLLPTYNVYAATLFVVRVALTRCTFKCDYLKNGWFK